MKFFSVHIFKSAFILFLAALVFVALAQSQPKDVVFIPYSGDTDSFVAQLYENGVLQNKFSELFLRFVLELKGEIEPGGYALHQGMGAASAALALGDPVYKYVFIDEGFRKGQIGEKIGEQLGWTDHKIQSFGGTLPLCSYVGQEGFLASGMYLLHKEEDPSIIQRTMQDTFNTYLSDLGLSATDEELPDIITIASLIQREAAGAHDMRLISGIIQNRLDIGMPLQIDATLQYVKGTHENWWPIPRPEDKSIDSLFNTYLHDGLPPAPIATPGKEAIKAAASPLATDCLFYLHDARRNIHCSVDYEGHKRNVVNYLR